VVAIVKVVVAAAVPGVTLAGLNEQLASEGSPEHVKEMAWLKPLELGVTVIVDAVELCPGALTVTVVGFAVGFPKSCTANWDADELDAANEPVGL
jgi:hypothetical protein